MAGEGVVIGYDRVPHGAVIALRVQGVVGADASSAALVGCWLHEHKKGWGFLEAEGIERPSDAADGLPPTCFFRVFSHPPQVVLDRQINPLSLQSLSSGYYLSRAKDKDLLSRSKGAKISEFICVAGYPIFQMYKSAHAQPAPLFIKDELLHCGFGNGSVTWDFFVIDQQKLEEKKAKEKGNPDSKKFFKRSLRKRDISDSSLARSALPPISLPQVPPSPSPATPQVRCCCMPVLSFSSLSSTYFFLLLCRNTY
jgi:hypothetical protein